MVQNTNKAVTSFIFLKKNKKNKTCNVKTLKTLNQITKNKQWNFTHV